MTPPSLLTSCFLLRFLFRVRGITGKGGEEGVRAGGARAKEGDGGEGDGGERDEAPRFGSCGAARFPPPPAKGECLRAEGPLLWGRAEGYVVLHDSKFRAALWAGREDSEKIYTGAQPDVGWHCPPGLHAHSSSK